MTIEERDACLASGKNILDTDLAALAAEVYSDDDLLTLRIEEFTLNELFTLLGRVIKQFMHELKSDNWKVLPNRFTDPYPNLTDAQNGVVLITKQIDYIDSALERKTKFDNWTHETLLLVRYEMHYGFWDRSKTRVHNPEDLNIEQSKVQVDLLAQALTQSMAETEKVRTELQTSIGDLSELVTQKEQQLASIERNLESSSTSLTEIRNAEKEASNSNILIGSQLAQITKDVEASRKKIAQDRKSFDELNASIEGVRQQVSTEFDELSEHRIEFDRLVIAAREAEKHILDQEERIMELVGFAADGTLGGVFSNRKKELRWTVLLWTILSAVSIGVALKWADYIFTNNPIKDATGVNWLIFTANLIRTSPAFLFIYFCLSRYTKERSIQEEYAFKAAISMTVTAYSDMIGAGDVNERVKMLMETIQRIYLPPALGKAMKPFSLRSKDFAEGTKNLVDLGQTLKSTVESALEKIKPAKPE